MVLVLADGKSVKFAAKSVGLQAEWRMKNVLSVAKSSIVQIRNQGRKKRAVKSAEQKLYTELNTLLDKNHAYIATKRIS
jgi:hypothetical protein